MDSATAHRSTLQDFENQDTFTPEIEPDLDSTSFFADKEFLEEQELSFSQKVERINGLFLRNNLNRPVLYRILSEAAAEPVLLSELEARVVEMPGFDTATQPPFTLIEWLIDAQAVSLVDVDEEGSPITDADKADKTEDEIDDMVFDQLVTITEQGAEALAMFDPAGRVADLLDEKPTRAATYIELLQFLKEKRSYGDIDKLLRGNPVLMDGVALGGRPMQPSVFVDKLASAGAIIYEQGWHITPEGLRVLEGQF